MSLSAAQLKRIKSINIKSKQLVHGFIKEIKARAIIPDLVIFHCLLYFHIFYEWDPENIGKYCSVLENNVLKVTLDEENTPVEQSAFLTNTIIVSTKENMQFNHWRFKLLRYRHFWTYNIIIGLWDINSDVDIKDALNTLWTHIIKGYVYRFSIGTYHEPDLPSWGGICCKDGYEQCKQDDILEMHLNQNVLEFKKNGQKLIKRKIKDSEYKLAIYAKPADIDGDQILIQLLPDQV